MRVALALLLSLAACAPAAAPAGGDVTVDGVVASVDLAPWAYDGNGLLRVSTADGSVAVEIPARANLCEASGLGLASELRPGDGVRVVGARQRSGAVVPCASPAHRIERR